ASLQPKNEQMLHADHRNREQPFPQEDEADRHPAKRYGLRNVFDDGERPPAVFLPEQKMSNGGGMAVVHQAVYGRITKGDFGLPGPSSHWGGIIKASPVFRLCLISPAPCSTILPSLNMQW